MKNDQFIDAVQTIGIITIAIVLSYVVVRLEGTLIRAADRLKKVLVHQNEILGATDRIGRRIEAIEAMLEANKAAIEALPDRLNGKRYDGHPSIPEERMSDPTACREQLSRADGTRSQTLWYRR